MQDENMKRLIVLFVFLVPSAVAQPVTAPVEHPVDMTKVLVDSTGKPIPDATGRAVDDLTCSKCPPLTIGAAVSLALDAAYPDEQNLGWQQRFDRGMLAQRIRNDPKAVLDGTEVGVIERLLGKAGMNGAVLMQVIETIDPNAKPGKVQ
jgi:hypothetical protein